MLEKGNVSKEEYRRLVKKGRRWFSEYLYMMADGALEEPEKSQLIKVICDIYKRDMAEDEKFFRAVEVFLSERRMASEKNSFFRGMMNRYVKSGEVHEAYYAKYPGKKEGEND